MKNLINKIGICFLLLAAQAKIYAQVTPAPYCFPIYFATPCNQPNPSNTPGNFINDFIHSFNTVGANINIVDNTQVVILKLFPELVKEITVSEHPLCRFAPVSLLPVTFNQVLFGRKVLLCLLTGIKITFLIFRVKD